ncbi:hypothetical protein D3C75_717310 [compost metagenome]
MGTDQDQHDSPQRFIQMKQYHQIELGAQHNSADGDKHSSSLHAHIQGFSLKLSPVHSIGAHSGYQKCTDGGGDA